MSVARRDPVASRRVDELLAVSGIVIEPVTEDQARRARDAYRDFGKGSGHRAGLDFGDCFAYALATSLGEPLLFTGDVFAATDVVPAVDAAAGAPDPDTWGRQQTSRVLATDDLT